MFPSKNNARNQLTSSTVKFPKLLELIDQSVIFVGALKDNKCKKLLQKTKSTFQWIPVGLNAKKVYVLRDAKTDLQELNRKCKNNTLDDKFVSEALRQKQADELGILDKTSAEFELHRKSFETEMLDWLGVLLASTDGSPSTPTLLEAS